MGLLTRLMVASLFLTHSRENSMGKKREGTREIRKGMAASRIRQSSEGLISG